MSRQQLDETASDYAREKLQERLAKLAGGVAVIRVGGLTETEVNERKDRVNDALSATRVAVEEGIAVGGGVALVHAADALDGVAGENADQNIGIAIFRRALDAPLRQIVDNAGFDGVFVVGKISEANEPGFGFDASKGDYGDLVERGIIDPVKVVRVCAENACSVAAALVTTQVAIAEDQADEEGTPDAT